MTAQFTHQGIQALTTSRPPRAAAGRLREACHRLRLAVQDMSYGARRPVEVQAPWIVDEQSHWR